MSRGFGTQFNVDLGEKLILIMCGSPRPPPGANRVKFYENVRNLINIIIFTNFMIIINFISFVFKIYFIYKESRSFESPNIFDLKRYFLTFTFPWWWWWGGPRKWD